MSVVVIAENDPDALELALTDLRLEGHEVHGARDAAEAEELIAELGPDTVVLDHRMPPGETGLSLVVLLDNRMPGLSGLEVAAEMLSSFPTQVVVLFSAHLDADIVAKAKSLGIAACVPQNEVTRLPAIIDQLLAAS